MSTLIQLDQKESQELFKTGGKVKIIMSNRIVYGFLFKWVPGETEFWLVDPKGVENGVRRYDYFRCQQIWYTPPGKNTSKFRKVLKEIESGKKLKKPLTADHANQLLHLIHEIDSLTSKRSAT